MASSHSAGPTGVTDFVLLPGEDVDDEGTAGGFSIAMLTSTQDSKAQGKGKGAHGS